MRLAAPATTGSHAGGSVMVIPRAQTITTSMTPISRPLMSVCTDAPVMAAPDPVVATPTDRAKNTVSDSATSTKPARSMVSCTTSERRSMVETYRARAAAPMMSTDATVRPPAGIGIAATKNSSAVAHMASAKADASNIRQRSPSTRFHRPTASATSPRDESSGSGGHAGAGDTSQSR